MEFVAWLEMGERAGRPGRPGFFDDPQPPEEAAEFEVTFDSRTPVDDEPGDLWVLDGVSLSWGMGEEPAQPEPVTCKYRLLARNPDALPPLQVGTLVHLRVDLKPETNGPASVGTLTAATFYGRITDAVARTVTFQGAPMLEVEVLALDHTAEYGEVYVGQAPWPQEITGARVERIIDAAGLEEAFTWTGVGATDGFFAAMDVDNRSFADLMEEHLRQIADGYVLSPDAGSGWFRGYAQPQLGGGSDPLEMAVAVEAMVERSGTPPRVLVAVDGLAVSMAKDYVHNGSGQEALTGVASVSARYCAADLEYRRSKATTVNRVVVAGEFEAGATEVVLEHPDEVRAHGPVATRLDSTLTTTAAARAMAAVYLPDEAEYVGRWGVQGVTIYAGAMTTATEAAALFQAPPLFPFHGQPDIFEQGQGFPHWQTFHVHGLQAGHRLAGDYAAGTLVGATLLIRGSAPFHERLLVEVELLPKVRRPRFTLATDSTTTEDVNRRALSPSALDANLPTMAYKGTALALDPSITYYDTRLIRHEQGAL